ncbi:hypothetical protein LINPERHAP2_LOCUS9227 [Linum perenne]
MKDEEVLFSKKVGGGQRRATRPREGVKQDWRRRPERSRQQGEAHQRSTRSDETYKNAATTNVTTLERNFPLHVIIGIRRILKEMSRHQDVKGMNQTLKMIGTWSAHSPW